MPVRPIIALGVLAAVLAGCGTAPARHAGRGRAGWTSFRDARNGLTVRFPSAWHRVRGSLTPHLADPTEILSVGTMAVPHPVNETCPELPVAGLRAAGARDVFLSLQERRVPGDGFAPRARPFRLGVGEDESRPGGSSLAGTCARGRRPWWSYWRLFSDAGRRFYLLAVIGDQAPARRVRQLHQVIDSLRFERIDPHAPFPRGGSGR